MSSRFFNPENGIWPFFAHVGDLVVLSLLWALCCLPLLTLGSATTALYDSVFHGLRCGEEDILGRYFRTFRKELKNGILSTLLWGGIAALYYLILQLLQGSGKDPVIRTGVTLFTLLPPLFLLGIFCWVFPLLSRFTFTTLALNITALRLSLGHILRSLLMALLALAAIMICRLFISPLIFVPGLTTLLFTYIMEPVFSQYQ